MDGLPLTLWSERERLQGQILRLVFTGPFHNKVAVLGGASLRFFWGLPRYSEDLDLALIDSPSSILEFFQDVIYRLQRFRPDLSFDAESQGLVNAVYIRTGNIELKVEAGARPLSAARIVSAASPLVQGLEGLTYDPASQLAIKVYLLLTRPEPKGRDFFDLGWYVKAYPQLDPNIPLLHQALDQKNYRGEKPLASNWRHCLRPALYRASWPVLQQDVRPCLPPESGWELMSREELAGQLFS